MAKSPKYTKSSFYCIYCITTLHIIAVYNEYSLWSQTFLQALPAMVDLSVMEILNTMAFYPRVPIIYVHTKLNMYHRFCSFLLTSTEVMNCASFNIIKGLTRANFPLIILFWPQKEDTVYMTFDQHLMSAPCPDKSSHFSALQKGGEQLLRIVHYVNYYYVVECTLMSSMNFCQQCN